MESPTPAQTTEQASNKLLSHDDIQNNNKINLVVGWDEKKKNSTYMAHTLFPSLPIARLLSPRAARFGSCQTCVLSAAV